MLSSKSFLSCGAALAVVLVSSQAAAQARDFNVPAQSAVSGIPEFARQARVQIIAPARDLEGVSTQAVIGQMDVRAGLLRLLEGTPLRIASDTNQLITLHSVRRSAIAPGAVAGTVIDPATGEYLRNATIQVEAANGERTSIAAGEGGAYRLERLAPGPTRFTVSFTGYPDQTAAVNLTAGETMQLDFQMTRPGSAAVDLGEVVVTSVRDGDARAIMSQRQSMDIKNSLSAESYGDISEGNPGEFIKFMPGVDTDSVGDGTVRTVQLRGLPPEYTSVTVNGVSLASADSSNAAEDRVFSFEQMSLSAIDSIEISKTISADVDANAPAGTINIRTKRAFDRRGRRILAQFSGATHSNMWDSAERTGPGEGGYGSTRFLPNGSIEYSDVFFGRRLGVVANASLSRTYVEQEEITLARNYRPTTASPDPLAITGFEAQMNAREIQRFSSSLGLDFRATENLTLSLASIYNESGIWAGWTTYDVVTGARTRGVTGDGLYDFTTRVPATANTVQVANSLTYKKGRNTTFIPSFEYDNGRIRLDGVLSHSRSVSEPDPAGEKGSAYTFSAIDSRGNFSMQRDAGDLFGQAWRIQQLDGPDWSDPTSFTPLGLVLRTNSATYAERTATSGALNLAFNARLLSVPIAFKTGLKMERNDWTREDRSDLYRYQYDGPLSRSELLQRIQSTNQYVFDDTGVSLTTLGGGQIYTPSTYKLLDLFRENPDDWIATATTSPTEWYGINVGNNRDFSEEYQAAYVMGTASLGAQLKVRGGLRWERTRTTSLEVDPLTAEEVEAAGYAVSASTGRATTIEGLEYQFLSRPRVDRKGEYDHLFPSASLKYSFTDSLDLQVGYSRTIRRPPLGVLSGTWSIDEEDQIVTAPNPGLKPELSDNLSVRLVKYFEPVGMVSINYYQNRVKGLFQRQDLTAEEFGYTGDAYADYIFRTTTTVGGEAIDIKGFELEFSHAMDYLPGPFDGLSVRGSLMINDPEIPIVMSADTIGSLSLSYRKGPAKLYFNSVWTDEKYRSTTPTWFDDYWDTNLSGSYAIKPGWETFFSIRNLFNQGRNVIVSGSADPSGTVGDHSAIYTHYGRNMTVGLRARF